LQSKDFCYLILIKTVFELKTQEFMLDMWDKKYADLIIKEFLCIPWILVALLLSFTFTTLTTVKISSIFR